ncbi:MAG: hypothetical protein K5666_01695 [Bacilli bacterium]|nr:hypothetical protein [Bacilli bacterium]
MLRINDKKAFRDLIVEKVKKVPEGQKLHIDKNIMEELLFDTFTCNEEKGNFFKLPVWSGEFLKKIDLSEISFEDVAWSLYELYRDFPFEEFQQKMDENFLSLVSLGMIENAFKETGCENINYSGTNVNIDFHKSFEYKTLNQVRITNCNFAGVDLSKSNMSEIKIISTCDLSDSNIKLSPDNLENNAFFWSSNFTNIDLSSFSAKAENIIGDKDVFSADCNLTNSKLNITFDENDMFWHDSKFDNKGFFWEFYKNITGCYLNGKLVTGESIDQETAEYEDYKNSLLTSLSNDLDEQIDSSDETKSPKSK